MDDHTSRAWQSTKNWEQKRKNVRLPFALLAALTLLSLLTTATANAQTATPTPTASLTAAAKLPAPALTATYAGSNAIELSWTPVPGATRYELLTWWANDPGWQQIGGDNLTATSFTDTDLTAGRTYRYAIRAFDANGAEGQWTAPPYPNETVPATGADTPTPTATAAATPTPTPTGASTLTPTPAATAAPLSVPNLTAQAAETGILLNWNAVPGAFRYQLLTWWANDPGWQPIGGGNLFATSFTHTTVTAGTTYHYSIRALNEAGDASPWITSNYPTSIVLATQEGATSTPTQRPAATEAATPTAAATPAPTATGSAAVPSTPNLTAQATNTGIILRWNIAPGATRYELLTWWDAGNGWQSIGGNNLTATTFIHTDVTAGTTYHYSIRALNANGDASPWITGNYPSATALATGAATPTPSPSPTPTPTATAAGTPTVIPTPTITPTSATTDRGALIALYHATNGDNWKNSNNWLTNAPLNSWYGVTADHNGRVHTLTLSRNRLTGPLPDLSALSDTLWLVDLRYNELSGPIPNLSALTELRFLDLSHNQLSGSVPDLSFLTLFKSLSLGSNQLSGPLINLQFLERLSALSLKENQFTGPLPDLSALTELSWLDLAGNRFCLPEGASLFHQNSNVAKHLMTLNLPACTETELSLPRASALNLTATVSTFQVTLTWDADANAESYELLFWDSLERRWDSAEGRLTTTTYTHPVLSDGRIYYFQIRARYAGGETGPWSQRVQAIVVPQRFPPPPPSLRINLFYQKYLEVNGVIIVAPSEVSDAGMERAGAIVAGMFAGKPVMFAGRPDKNLRIAIFKMNAKGERSIQVPELVPSVSDHDGRAFWTEHEWISIVPEDDRQYCYVFIHETAHAIQFALEDQPDGQEFRSRLEALYHAALGAGLWDGTYASTNVDEYWAETVTFWFHEYMHEPYYLAGAKLKRYDPEIAKLIAETFGDEAYVPDYCKP